MLYDLQGAQSVDHRDRGVARYVVELACALERLVPSPVEAFLLNPDLPLPSSIEPLVASGKVRFVDEPDVYRAGAVVHLASPIELSIPFSRLLPPAARDARVRVVTTVFDLIPESMPDVYLRDPGQRRRYRARLELVRSADGVLAISRYVADDVQRRLGIPAHRVSTIPLVASGSFRPPTSRTDARRAAQAGVPGLRVRYVLYTGGSDGRKNVEGLLDAWSLLPAGVRDRYQLVIAGSLPPLHRNHLEVTAERLGFGGGLLCTGFVREDVLVALNQAADLVVCPSLGEGFGLPVVEALAAGAPAIAADNTSLVELLPDFARFDATSAPAIASAVTRALTDEAHRRRLLDVAARQPVRTWDDVAAATADSYPVCAPTRPRRAQRRTFRLAFVSPLPPQPGGVADYTRKLLGPLRERCVVDAFVDGPPHRRADVLRADAPDGVSARPLATFERVEELEGRYDEVVYALGNSEYHTGTLATLLRRPGAVLAHDVRLTALYQFAAWQHPAAAPGGFHPTLQRMYEGRLPAELGERGLISDDEAERWGVLMARDAVAASTAFFTTSEFAARLARLDARPDHRDRIHALPFGMVSGGVPGVPAAGAAGPPVVVSFGVLGSVKQGPLLVRAVAALTHRDVKLVFVGPASDIDAESVRATAAAAGIADHVEVTGHVDEDTYRAWLGRATVAVQLRATTNGETSAAVADCLAAGVPTVVTAIGSARSLTPATAVGVPPEVDDASLASVLDRLLASEEDRRRLSVGGRAYASERSFEAAADALLRALTPVLE